MKKIKTFTLALLVFMSISSVSVSAESPDTNFTDVEVGIEDSAVSNDAMFEELKSDFEIIDQIEEDSAQEFYENNTDWIEDVNSKLENYLAAYPESERSGIIAKLMNINPMSRAVNYYYWDIGTYDQGSTRLCWAITTSLIGNFKTGRNYSPYTVAANQGLNAYSGGSIDNSMSALRNLYGLNSYFYNRALSIGEVGNNIQSWNLMYGAFYYADWSGGHAVPIMGYYVNGTNAIMVSESLGGNYKTIYPNNRGQYTLAAGGTCYWSQTYVA